MKTKESKWNESLNLIIESVYKPDSELRISAHEEECYEELMELRSLTLNFLQSLRK